MLRRINQALLPMMASRAGCLGADACLHLCPCFSTSSSFLPEATSCDQGAVAASGYQVLLAHAWQEKLYPVLADGRDGFGSFPERCA